MPVQSTKQCVKKLGRYIKQESQAVTASLTAGNYTEHDNDYDCDHEDLKN
jgi:hypothetical protein